MAYRTVWAPVYPGLSKLPQYQVHHLTIDTLRRDTACIASVASNMGIFSLICQKALKETAEYIKQHGLTYEQSDELIKWICERTFTRPSQETPSHDDGGREKGVRGGVEDVGKVKSKPRKKVTRGSNTGRDGGRDGREDGVHPFDETGQEGGE